MTIDKFVKTEKKINGFLSFNKASFSIEKYMMVSQKDGSHIFTGRVVGVTPMEKDEIVHEGPGGRVLPDGSVAIKEVACYTLIRKNSIPSHVTDLLKNVPKMQFKKIGIFVKANAIYFELFLH